MYVLPQVRTTECRCCHCVRPMCKPPAITYVAQLPKTLQKQADHHKDDRHTQHQPAPLGIATQREICPHTMFDCTAGYCMQCAFHQSNNNYAASRGVMQLTPAQVAYADQVQAVQAHITHLRQPLEATTVLGPDLGRDAGSAKYRSVLPLSTRGWEVLLK